MSNLFITKLKNNQKNIDHITKNFKGKIKNLKKIIISL